MNKDKERDEEPAASFDDDQQQMFRNENEAARATRTAEALEDDITLPGVERPGNEEIKNEKNFNTE
ncbi:MAG: hypothetical protein ABR577_17130 [Pyrinomonadaceae bacterium]